MELRASVTEFVHEKIRAMRTTASSAITTLSEETTQTQAVTYHNISVLRANSMKFMPNFFVQAQLSSLFFCFPDPHFKARKHKARIVSSALVAEYAFILRPGGVVYTITDVQDLHLWMAEWFDSCPLFERLLIAEYSANAEYVEEKGDLREEEEMCVEIMKEETEEGKKVQRNGGTKYVACWRRSEDPEWP
jgi:tRNA (guanine-N7-)-methyltransferase